MQNPSQRHHPIAGALPFNNLPGPLSPRDALTLPGDNIFKRIYWAIVMQRVALKAEAAKQITGMVIQQQALEDEIRNEILDHRHRHKRMGHIGRQDGGPGHEEGFDAGEIDQFDNGPDVSEMYKNPDEKTQVHWLVRIIRIYYITFLPIYNILGLKRDPEGELSDEALDEWVAKNESNLEFQRLKSHLLNSLSEHSRVFDLTQIEFADRFLNRLAVTVLVSGKTLQDVQLLNQVQLGSAVANAFSHQLNEMSQLANQLVDQTTQALQNAGVMFKPTSAPNLTPAVLNKAVLDMGPAQHPAEQAQALSMERLSTISAMFPMVPKPQNTQRREHAKQVGAERHGKALSQFNTNAKMGVELAEYANAIGVDPRVLEQAADHTRMNVLKQDGPEHAQAKQSMRETTAFPKMPVHTPAKAIPLKPSPPLSRGS